MNEVVHAAAAYIDVNGLYGTSYKESVKKNSKEKIHVAVDAADTYLYGDRSTICRWRTLIFLDGRRTSKVDERLANILSHADGLRALDLSSVRLRSRSPPENIRYLMLLSFLDLSFTNINTFPGFLCEFTQLKFLGLKGCKFSQLPKKITKLRNLEHLSAEPDTYAMIEHVGKLTALLDLQLFRVKREEMVFCGMPNLVRWTPLLPHQLMPKLRKVQIIKCKRLEEAPLCSFRAPLTDLVLSDCPLVLESTGTCLSGLETLKHLAIQNISNLKTLPWNHLSAVELLKVENCDGLSLDGSELLGNIKRLIRDRVTVVENFEKSSYNKVDMLQCSTSSAPSTSPNNIAEVLSNDSAKPPSLYWKVTDPLSLGGLQDLHGFTRSVYEKDHALITPESHSFRAVPKWSNTSGAYLIIPDIGAKFAMYFAKMEGGSKSAQPTEGVARFLFVLKGNISLSLGSEITHPLSVDGYAYIPANMKHYVVANESTTLIIIEKRYKAIEEYHPDLIVSSVNKQPFIETPGEVFQLRKLLPTSLEYDFNIHEVHYNEHGLLLLEGQGIYKFGKEGHLVQAGDAIWTAPLVPHWYATHGKAKTKYLLYENVNRDPLML